MTKHFKSNGNGKLLISKPAMTFISLIMLVIGMIIPAVFAYGKLNTRVDNLENVWEDAQDKHPDYVESVDKILDKHSEKIIESSIILIEIRNDISDIKFDIKDIKQDLKEVK